MTPLEFAFGCLCLAVLGMSAALAVGFIFVARKLPPSIPAACEEAAYHTLAAYERGVAQGNFQRLDRLERAAQEEVVPEGRPAPDEPREIGVNG